MAQEANGSNLYIGRGRLYFDRFDTSGNSTGFRFLGEVSKIDLTASVTTKEHFTSTKATNVKIANIPIQQKHVMTFDQMEFTRENVALAILGDASVVTQSLTTVTAGSETIAGGAGQGAPAVGRTYATAKKNISATSLSAISAPATVNFTGNLSSSSSPTVIASPSSTAGLSVGMTVTGTGIPANTTLTLLSPLTMSNGATVTGTAVAITAVGSTTTALVLNTDYAIEDAQAGLITLLSTLAGSAASITAGYTAGAINSFKVTGGTSANIRGAFKFIGDPTSGPKMNLSVWKTEVTPSSALSLLSDDFGTMSLSAEVLDDSTNHPTSPLYEAFYV